MSEDFKPTNLLSPKVTIQNGENGVIYIDHVEALQDYPTTMTERLFHWANVKPDALYLAARDKQGDWEKITYAQAAERVLSLSQALLNMGLTQDKTVAILSGNSLAHALLSLACQHIGSPVSPISPAYALISKDYGKLRHVLGLLDPSVIFVEELAPFVEAIKAVAPDVGQVIAVDVNSDAVAATAFADLLDTPVTDAVAKVHATVTPDTIAKILFTSGSTGMPKGVINTQRMICSNQQAKVQALKFLSDHPPVIVDWLPWNHTFGGNHNFNIILNNGGTLYIDEGKPTPAGIEATIRNLCEISPTMYFNVPKGYEALLPYFDTMPELREKFFAHLDMMFYAGAGLSRAIYDELQALSVAVTGKKVFFTTSLGSTETAPSSVFNTNIIAMPGEVGLPLPGITLKKIPNGGKLELRVKGPNVTPGYWKQPELTEGMFDEEGFYKLGDAVKFADNNDHERGLVFDGRISEDFKLDTGTWVCVSSIRIATIHQFSPLISDVVVTGHDRKDIGVMAVPIEDNCRKALGHAHADLSFGEFVKLPEFRALILEKLKDQASKSTGSSNRVARLSFMLRPPALDAHEITDKGSLNQRSLLENRHDDVVALYNGDAADGIFTLKQEA